MTKKLEEEFNLPPLEEALAKENPEEVPSIEETKQEIVAMEDALSVSEKINMAFKEVKGLEEHEHEFGEPDVDMQREHESGNGNQGSQKPHKRRTTTETVEIELPASTRNSTPQKDKARGNTIATDWNRNSGKFRNAGYIKRSC